MPPKQRPCKDENVGINARLRKLESYVDNLFNSNNSRPIYTEVHYPEAFCITLRFGEKTNEKEVGIGTYFHSCGLHRAVSGVGVTFSITVWLVSV